MRHARDGWLGPDGTWHAGEPPRGWRRGRDGRWRPALAAPMRAPRYVPPPPAQALAAPVEPDPDATTAGLMRRGNLDRQDVPSTRPQAAATPAHPGARAGGPPESGTARTAVWPDDADDPKGPTPADDDEPRHLVDTGAVAGMTTWLPSGVRAAAQRAVAGARSSDVRTRIGAGLAAVVLLVGLTATAITVFGSNGGDGSEVASSTAPPVSEPPASSSPTVAPSTDTTSEPSPTTESTTTTSLTTTTAPSTSTTASTTTAPPATPPPSPARTDDTQPTERPSTQDDVYYRNCGEVWRDDAAPLRRGDPGYRAELDRNDDGLACWPGWRRDD